MYEIKAYLQAMVNGEKNNLGDIQCLFFDTVFSDLSSVKVHLNWPEYLPFANDDIPKRKNCLLCFLDDESVETPVEEIRELMEIAHLRTITGIGKSLKDMGIHYDYIGYIPKKEEELALINYFAENGFQCIEESVGNKNINSRENIIEEVPVQVSVYYSEAIHDRWWIVKNVKKGILCGTSLNGIGKDKLSTITPLSEDDVEKIINDSNNIVDYKAKQNPSCRIDK